MADNLTSKVNFPPAVDLSPGVVMSSNLHLFREIRFTDGKLTDAILRGNGLRLRRLRPQLFLQKRALSKLRLSIRFAG